MSETTGPKFATDDEYDEVVDLLDRVFRYGTGRTPANIPNWFDPDHPERYAVIKQDGKVVSTVGCIPQRFVVGGGEIDCWAVGNVATDKPYRGNGYMTSLLEFWLDFLRDKDIPLAELGGDRQRYNRFGWENAGREYTYVINDRSFQDVTLGSGTVRKYTGTEDDIELISDIHSSEDYRVKRTKSEYRALFDQQALTTLLYTGDPDPAYICFNQEVPSGRYSTAGRTRTVPEFGGSTVGINTAISHIKKYHDAPKLEIPVHSSHPNNDHFLAISSSWTMHSHRMVNILNFSDVLSGFALQLEAHWEEATQQGESTVTLEIEDSDSQPLTISGLTDGIHIHAAPQGEADVSLNQLQMTRLLFGFPDRFPTLRREFPLLDALLPLDFYIWKIEGP